MLDHRAQILTLTLKVEFIHLCIQNWPDDAAPLVSAEEAVADMLQFCQIGAEIAALGKPIYRRPGEPKSRQQQYRAYRQADVGPLRTFALMGRRLCAQIVHVDRYEYKRPLGRSRS